MATAVLRSHDVLNNRMHLDAFTPSPTKPRRRRSPKPAGASSPPPKALASPAPKSPAVPPKPVAAPKAAAVASPPAKGRRSPPPKSAARKQPSPTKEKPPVMREIRILKRCEELPAPAPAPAPVAAPPVAQAAPVNKRVIRSTSRIGPKEATVMPKRVVSAPDVAVYAGPAFASAPEPSSLPFPAFCLRRAETEATRGLRCLLGIGQVA
ncbi:hypothetical protein QOZ80_2BG0205150 [Eleusine coracana subsp. coracana]|nr:hypothetical protein QOZ80_2BG0205150 [Eleusine coracana subsp. coracana]